MPYSYAIARGHGTAGYIACDANLRLEWRRDALEAAGGNREALRECRALSRRYVGPKAEGCNVLRREAYWFEQCQNETVLHEP